MEFDKIYVNNLKVTTIIGINPSERVNKQEIIINLVLFTDIKQCAETDNIDFTTDYAKLSGTLA
jgi:FolB domain-containing protein